MLCRMYKYDTGWDTFERISIVPADVCTVLDSICHCPFQYCKHTNNARI